MEPSPTVGGEGRASTRQPAYVLLLGAAWPALAAVAIVTLVTLVLSGPAGACSAAVCGALAVAALATGPVAMRIGRDADPFLVLGIAVTTYALTIIVCAIAVGALAGTEWLLGGPAAAGFGSGVMAWIAGYLRALMRLRVPVFDLDNP